jgi:GH15 family glucan-1,4-alpha-glucosidase
MTDLFQRSLEIILEHQSPNGAYIASPNFPTYHYCWFRDGSFIAHAMDLAYEPESAHRFHGWVAERVNERKALVLDGLAKRRSGGTLSESEILHTRYHLDGTDGKPGEWPNFQLDGFGTWLWALNEHQKQNPEIALPNDWLDAADLVADYLRELWSLPCYDCWEEFPERVHPHTLAAIYGGLRAHMELTGRDHQSVTDMIRTRLLAEAKPFGHFVKFSMSPAVDASLLGLTVPYAVVEPDNPLMLRTVEVMESTILRDGGLHRYAEDTYFGGGAWILLTAWLGWYYTELAAKRPDPADNLQTKIQTCRRWIEARAGTDLCLPEQVAEHLNAPEYYEVWVERWGKIASPLLWSHANYIILRAKNRLG